VPLKEANENQINRIKSRLSAPFSRKEGIHPIDLKKRVRKIADEHLWVLRNGMGLRKAVLELTLTIANELPRLSIQTATRIYNKEWIDEIEVDSTAQVLIASARSALLRTESRGVHNRSDYPLTDNNRWLREVITRKSNGKLTLLSRPITITRIRPPRGRFGFEEGIMRAVKELGE
jgi:succinate dehydrogenase/fumarate reductase flavoprotein subunit